MTFDPILAKVKVNLYAKNQGHRSNSLAVRVHTDRQTGTHTHRGPITIITSSANVRGKNTSLEKLLFENDLSSPCGQPRKRPLNCRWHFKTHGLTKGKL